MRDEPELYPPDVDVVTPEMKAMRQRAMVGTFLVTLGTGLLLERTFNNNLEFFSLAIGFALLAAWAKVPRYGWFAWGAIITGSAVGGFLQSLAEMRFESTIGFLCSAAGWFAVYVRYPHKARWMLIPTGILTFIAVAATGIELIGLLPSILTSVGLPAILMAGGALLLFRNSLPPKFVKIGLIVLAVMFVMSAASSADKWDSPDVVNLGIGSQQTTVGIPGIDEGKQLIVETESGSVTLVTGATGTASATAIAGGGKPITIDVDEDDDTVHLAVRRHGPGFFDAIDSASWRISVPADAFVSVTTESGSVSATLGGGEVDIETDSGSVIATVEDDHDTLRVSTDAGAIQVNGNGPADLTIDSDDGAVVVGGVPAEDGKLRRESAGPTVELESDEGSIVVNGIAA